jgi:hypothetical protein
MGTKMKKGVLFLIFLIVFVSVIGLSACGEEELVVDSVNITGARLTWPRSTERQIICQHNVQRNKRLRNLRQGYKVYKSTIPSG